METAAERYRIEMVKAPRRKRLWSSLAALVTSLAVQDVAPVNPIMKRYRVIDIHTGETVIDLDETAFDTLDLGKLLFEDLENLSADHFHKRWIKHRL